MNSPPEDSGGSETPRGVSSAHDLDSGDIRARKKAAEVVEPTPALKSKQDKSVEEEVSYGKTPDGISEYPRLPRLHTSFGRPPSVISASSPHLPSLLLHSARPQLPSFHSPLLAFPRPAIRSSSSISTQP